MAFPNLAAWRNKEQLYKLVGEACPHCDKPLFPPRDVCPECRNNDGKEIGEPELVTSVFLTRPVKQTVDA